MSHRPACRATQTHPGRLRLLPHATAGALLVMVAAASTAPAHEPQLQMSEQTRSFLDSILDANQRQALQRTLTAADTWGSLGPHPTGGPEPLPVDPPEQRLDLSIADDAQGTGTAEDPYVNVISNFLARFDYDPIAIEAYQSYPDQNQIDRYMTSLAYAPKRLVIPPGHYRETMKTQDSPHRHYEQRIVALDVPPGIWLEGDGQVVIEPDVDEGTVGTLVNLNIHAALVNVVLDGSGIPGFEPRPQTRINGVKAAHHAVIADNHIHRFTHRGITAAGNRGRAGSNVIVSNNLIEDIGYSGISSQSRWIVRDNQIRYAGALRAHGGADDGIIPRHGIEGKIVNNLVVLAPRPNARHVISGQVAHDVLVAGNITIAQGSVRNNIGFSDGSHRNRILANVILGMGESDSAIQAAVSMNGYGNVITNNFAAGNPRAFRATGQQDQPLNRIAENYAEYVASAIHRSRYYEAADNDMRQTGTRRGDRFISPLPIVELERFGYFQRVQR